MANIKVKEKDKKKIRTVSLSDLEVKAIQSIPEAEGSLTKGIRFLLNKHKGKRLK